MSVVFEELKSVLAIDLESRTNDYKQNPDFDLHELNKTTNKSFDGCLPFIRAHTSNSQFISNANEFAAKFEEKYFYIKNILTHPKFEGHIVLAGGAVSSIINNTTINDFDLFIHGISPDKATEFVYGIIEHCVNEIREEMIEKNNENRESDEKQSKELKKGNNTQAFRKKNYDNYETIKILYNDNCMSFFRGYKIQIIFRVYDSISQIIHGFDIGASAMAYDGKKIYMTSLAKFANEYTCNIVDTTRRSTSYEHRLKKYYGKGYSIILPHIAPAKIRTVNQHYNVPDTCILPYLPFVYESFEDNIFTLKLFITKFDECLCDYENIDEDDYYSNYDYYLINANLKTIAREFKKYNGNIEEIPLPIPGLYSFQKYTISEHTNVSEIINSVKNLTPFVAKDGIVKFYSRYIKNAVEKDEFNIKSINMFVYNSSEIWKILELYETSNDEFKRRINEIFTENKNKFIAICDKIIRTTHTIKWRTINPATQLSGSFNPIIEDTKKYYGEYYEESLAPTNTRNFKNNSANNSANNNNDHNDDHYDSSSLKKQKTSSDSMTESDIDNDSNSDSDNDD